MDWRNSNSFASCSTDKTIFVCKVGEEQPVKKFSGHTGPRSACCPVPLLFARVGMGSMVGIRMGRRRWCLCSGLGRDESGTWMAFTP